MGSTISVKPSEILYSQDSILCYFDARGWYSCKKIGETLDDICEGRCSVDDIPRIRVAKEGNRWVTADNRRLWVFKHLERLGKCGEIQVDVIDYIEPGKRTSTSGGMWVRVRGGEPGGYWHNRQPGSNDLINFVEVLSGFVGLVWYFLCLLVRCVVFIVRVLFDK